MHEHDPLRDTVGVLKPGTTLTVRVGDAPFNAFQPAAANPAISLRWRRPRFQRRAVPPAPALRAAAAASW